MSEHDYQVFANQKDNVNSSEIAARDEHHRKYPPVTGLDVGKDLRSMDLIRRPWRNNKGGMFHLAGNNVLQTHVSELKAGGNSTRHRHTTEAYIYIVKGKGYSIINYDDEPPVRVDWSEGCLFSPPVWAWHQHFNTDPNETARYMAVQDTGLLRQLRLHNIERHPTQMKVGEGLEYEVNAVGLNDDPSEEHHHHHGPALTSVLSRENGTTEHDYQVMANEKGNLGSSEIAARDEHHRIHPPVTGLDVGKDLRSMDLIRRPWRNNKGGMFHLAGNNVLQAHVSELKPGGNSTRHRHTTEAYIYIVKGKGYSIISYDDEPPVRVDWSEGCLFSPPVWAWHQHFNTDPNDTARYLAVQDTGLLRHLRLHNIERHHTQLTVGEGLEYEVNAVGAEAVEGRAGSRPALEAVVGKKY